MNSNSRSNVVDLPLPQVAVMTLGQYTSSLSLQQLAALPRSIMFKERDRLETLMIALQDELELDHGLHLTSLEHVLELAIVRYAAVGRLLRDSAVS